MADLLVRNVKPETLAHLKRKAASHGRSVQAEIHAILDEDEERTRRMREFWKEADAIRESLEGTDQTDSAVLRRIGRRGE